MNYNKALQIAIRAHRGQTRKFSCVPYIVHPVRVAIQFSDDLEKSIAVLHDVIEDTEITIEDLKNDFSDYIVEKVDLLTRKEGEKYFDYIRKIDANKIATKIKIVDIIDNLSETPSQIPLSMAKRYAKALDILLKTLKK